MILSPKAPSRRGGGLLVAFIIFLLCFNCLSFLLNLWVVRQIGLSSADGSSSSSLQNSRRAFLGTPAHLRAKPRWQDNAEPPPPPSPSIETPQMEFVYEVGVPPPPSIYLMIPSVPRKENPDYLIQVLDSLVLGGLPQSHIYAFHNGPPQQDHPVWERARSLYPKAHFVRNERPLPEASPSVHDISLPLPEPIQEFVDLYNDTQIIDARNDTDTRKDWRRKECYDFVTMFTYMMNVAKVGGSASPEHSDTWLIFNQDDAKWKKSFGEILPRLQHAETKRVDLHADGLVSVAFHESIWKDLMTYAHTWCDFKPVDWLVWDFFRIKGHCTKCDRAPRKTVMHIGEVSSRWGRVANAEEEEKEKTRLRREAAKAAALERVKNAKKKLKTDSDGNAEEANSDAKR